MATLLLLVSKGRSHAPHNVLLCFIIHDLSMEVQYFYLRMITTVLITGQVKFLCVGHQNC